MNVETSTIEVIVKSVTHEAKGIRSYEFQRLDGRELPSFEAGAHIDLHLTNGMVRSYSLLGDPSEQHYYKVAVALDPRSRGGSRHIHEQLQPGDRLKIGIPRNNFPLDESAHLSVFIAGGIGVTPILAMIKRLNAIGKPWLLYYGARDVDSCAFLTDLAVHRGLVMVRLESADKQSERRWDIREIVGRHGDAHFYCCGPAPMLDAFVTAAADLDRGKVHLEYFSGQGEAATEGGFVIRLAKSQKTLSVQAGQSILETILESGVEVMNSCREGVCGACEVKVLDGIPDHRDSILSEAERKAARTMFVCVSGCKSKDLVLDL